MPKPCRLCSHDRADEIDAFVRGGHSYADFCKEFPDATVHMSAWSRHRTQHLTASASAAEIDQYCAGLTVKALRKVNRALVQVAARAKRKGKTSDELSAYKLIVENQARIRELELEQQEAAAATQPAAQSVEPITAEEGTRKLIEMLQENDNLCDWIKLCAHRAGKGHLLIPSLANVPNNQAVAELRGNRGLYERYRLVMQEVERWREAPLPSTGFEPAEISYTEDQFPEAQCGAENVAYSGEHIDGDWADTLQQEQCEKAAAKKAAEAAVEAATSAQSPEADRMKAWEQLGKQGLPPGLRPQ